MGCVVVGVTGQRDGEWHDHMHMPSIIAAVVYPHTGPVKETLQPYVAFHAALRSAHMAFVARLEAQARTLLRHHLDTATSEFALSLLMSSVSLEPAAAYQQQQQQAAPMPPPGGSRRAQAAAAADEGENVPPQDEAADDGQVTHCTCCPAHHHLQHQCGQPCMRHLCVVFDCVWQPPCACIRSRSSIYRHCCMGVLKWPLQCLCACVCFLVSPVVAGAQDALQAHPDDSAGDSFPRGAHAAASSSGWCDHAARGPRAARV